jgi:hypothetical protein
VGLTRRCRALRCPRYVPDTTLFCNVHFKQLPPKYLQPIANNRDVPSGGTINDAAKVVNGTRAAVNYLAGKEGKQQEQRTAAAAAAASPTQPRDASESVSKKIYTGRLDYRGDDLF